MSWAKLPRRMLSEEERFRVRRDALHAAKTKARLDDEHKCRILRRKLRARLALGQGDHGETYNDQDARRVLEEEEVTVQRIAPEKEFVAKYFLSERTPEMKARRLRYKFIVSEEEDDDEVTLHMFQRSKRRRIERSLGEAGDLYRVELTLPGRGGKMFFNIIAESQESSSKPKSDLFYSCFDIGHCDKAFTVPAEAWQTYLLWWPDEVEVRDEMDLRLLFIALVNLDIFGRRVSLDEFRLATLNDIIILMNSMTPGKTYPRPTTEEALLTNRTEPGQELLRMGKIAKANLAPRFNYLGVKRKPKKQPLSKPIVDLFVDDLSQTNKSPRTSPLRPIPNEQLHFNFNINVDQIPRLPIAAGQLILDCFNPNSEDNRFMQRVNADIRDFCARDPRTPAATLKSWKESGWKPTSSGKTPPSRNPSEEEAMGPDDDLNIAVREDEDFQPDHPLANISLTSGFELLAVSNTSRETSPGRLDLSTLEERSGQGLATAPSQVAKEMARIVPGGAEDEGEEWGSAYLLNDSIDLYLLSRPTGEEFIFNITSEDSVSSAFEEVPMSAEEPDIEASSSADMRSKDY